MLTSTKHEYPSTTPDQMKYKNFSWKFLIGTLSGQEQWRPFADSDLDPIEKAYINGNPEVTVVSGTTDLVEDDASENPIKKYTIDFRRKTGRHVLKAWIGNRAVPMYAVQRTNAPRDPTSSIDHEWLASYLHDPEFQFAVNADATKSWNVPGSPNELISGDQLVTHIQNFGKDGAIEITKYSTDDAIDQQVQRYKDYKDTDSARTSIFCRVSTRGGLIRPLCVIKRDGADGGAGEPQQKRQRIHEE